MKYQIKIDIITRKQEANHKPGLYVRQHLPLNDKFSFTKRIHT